MLLCISLCPTMLLQAQVNLPNKKQSEAVSAVINTYSKARKTSDTGLLKRILTTDVDQLVSTGEWRKGMDEAVQGMLKSSSNSPGQRTLHIETIRMLNANAALVDCRYEIQNRDSSVRKMWSTFIVIATKEAWKIAAIRNMAPTGQ